jgi:hypothetical protein
MNLLRRSGLVAQPAIGDRRFECTPVCPKANLGKIAEHTDLCDNPKIDQDLTRSPEIIELPGFDRNGCRYWH